MNYDDVLTQKTAVAIAREWIDDQIVRPKGHLRSQRRWLMEQLATRCIAESLHQQEKEDELCERLRAAWDILHSVWYAAAPDYATRWRKEDEQLDVDERKQIEQAKHIVWRRHDPKRSIQDGFESEHHFGWDRDSLDSIIANYLERPWLRHPTLDWILLDMTITRELCSFGEELKMQWVPGKRDDLGPVHYRYFSTKGNLSKMTEIKWSELFENLWKKFVGLIAMPVGAIWASFYYGYSGLGATLASIYGVLVAGYGAIKVVRFLSRSINRLIGRPDPRLKPFLLWNDMYEVWRRLDGPVVNPSRVRESMAKSTDKGARWDATSWSLVDRLIAIDPAVWVIQPAAAQ